MFVFKNKKGGFFAKLFMFFPYSFTSVPSFTLTEGVRVDFKKNKPKSKTLHFPLYFND